MRFLPFALLSGNGALIPISDIISNTLYVFMIVFSFKYAIYYNTFILDTASDQCD